MSKKIIRIDNQFWTEMAQEGDDPREKIMSFINGKKHLISTYCFM